MDDQLKNIRDSLQNVPGLTFSNEDKQKIQKRVKKHNITPRKSLLVSIFQLLEKPKDGTKLLTLLRARGIKNFEGNEGVLFIKLHELEQEGLVQSRWINDRKEYEITKHGRKKMCALERNRIKEATKLYEIWER